MNQHIMRPAALAVSILVLASCKDTPTEPETAEAPAAITNVAAASNTWTTKATMPGIARGGLATATVTSGGRSILYAIGGQTVEGGSLGKVQAYDVQTNTWTNRASLPIAVFNTNGAGVINGKIYISGGVTKDKVFRQHLFMYDPATDTWTRKRDMVTGTWGGLTAVINNQLYVLTCLEQEDCYIDMRSLYLYRYDPATDQWTLLATPPAQVQRPMGGTIGGKLYFTGVTRSRASDGSITTSATLTVYDPATNQFTQRTPLARPRWDGAGETVGARLYVFGGREPAADGTTRRVRTTSMYNPVTDSWTNRAPMPDLRSGYSASRVQLNGQGRIEVVGGPKPGNNLQYEP